MSVPVETIAEDGFFVRSSGRNSNAKLKRVVSEMPVRSVTGTPRIPRNKLERSDGEARKRQPAPTITLFGPLSATPVPHKPVVSSPRRAALKFRRATSTVWRARAMLSCGLGTEGSGLHVPSFILSPPGAMTRLYAVVCSVTTCDFRPNRRSRSASSIGPDIVTALADLQGPFGIAGSDGPPDRPPVERGAAQT